jgi:hypothetical protein
MRVNRFFQEIPDDKIIDMDQASVAASMGWSSAFKWSDLLESDRVLIVAEAGAGKTYECRQQQEILWDAGEPAFFLELAELSRSNVRDMLSPDQEQRLDAWLASQSDRATFFLDSIDELKLSLGSFEQALKRLERAIHGQLARARIVITTRPTPVDQQFVKRLLPASRAIEEVVTGETFAAIALRRDSEMPKARRPEIWRSVVLLPLSNDQIRQMAASYGVSDPDALLADIDRRHAMEFARRPQDLIELCIDWRDHNRIRTHHDQVAYDVHVKLQPRTCRREKAQLSDERAFEGASRLALAAILTRKLTLRHSAEADVASGSNAALNPALILSDWTADERETLLERALFGFASYGRVRFHHRSVMEWLAAYRLRVLTERGMSFRTARRLLLAETAEGKRVVRPSFRPVAAWLSLHHQGLFEELRDREPEILLNFGDPESLTAQQRSQALIAYVERYGPGGWRGMQVPGVQVQRFASEDMSADVQNIWNKGIENSEVRELLLRLIGAGRMKACLDVAHDTAVSTGASDIERLLAVDALTALSDPRLQDIADAIEVDAAQWPDALARSAIFRLFPQVLKAAQLCRVLSRLSQGAYSAGDLSWQLPNAIMNADLSVGDLETLRRGLSSLLTESAAWSEVWPNVRSSKSYLAPALAATCLCQIEAGYATGECALSIAGSLRIKHRDYIEEAHVKRLKTALASASASLREAVFWANDAFSQQVCPARTLFQRYFQATHEGPIEFDVANDRSWILTALADQGRPSETRAIMLEVAMRLWDGKGDWREYVQGLLPLVADSPDMVSTIESKLKPIEPSLELQQIQEEAAQHREEIIRRDALAHASWVHFWQEVSDNPDKAFEQGRDQATALNLWRVMEQAGEESRSSGWNRRFIERSFGKDVADRLRLTLIRLWRNDRPTLRSERTEGMKNTFLMRWQLGLAAITAEAEDRCWAQKLTEDEAGIAARYAPIQLNSFPKWLEDLVIAHPTVVDCILGGELSRELRETVVTQVPSMTLQNISHSTPQIITLFLPRLIVALNHICTTEGPNSQIDADRLAQIIDLVLRHGDVSIVRQIATIADARLQSEIPDSVKYVWLAALMGIDPEVGVARLETILNDPRSFENDVGINWIAALFGDLFRRSLFDLRSERFSPGLLLRLVRLAYLHVRIADDVQRDGHFTPGTRDHAEHGRAAIMNALLYSKGSAGWAAKLEMAADPMFASFRYRAIAIAEERAAEDADGVPYSEVWVRSLDRYKEAPPVTRDEMFALMVDRLDDIEDMLLQDISPRAAWALIRDETIMRREIARALLNAANDLYTVDQEAVTADQKETDIRLRSTGSGQQGVIELKIGEKERSARDLRDALVDQLVTKYMAAEDSRSGCLLITATGNRTWQHPRTNQTIDLEGLVAMLSEEATRVVAEMGGSLRLCVRGLDLRPRLTSEAMAVNRNRR